MRKLPRSLFLTASFAVFTFLFGHAQDCSPDTSPPVFEPAHPLMQGIGDGDVIHYQCGEQDAFFAEYLSAVDNCDPDPQVSFSKGVSIGNCAVDDFMVSVEYCWKATDSQANEATFCFTAIVSDEVFPVFDQLPADLTIDLSLGDTLPAAAVLVADDDCHGILGVSFDVAFIFPPDSCGFTLLRKWSAADPCGNEISHTQTITAMDECETCPTDIIQNVDISAADCQTANGGFVLEVEGSAGDYSFSSSPSFGTQTGAGNVFSQMPPGNYEVTVTHLDIADCQAVVNVEVPQNSCSDTVQVNLTGAGEYCLPSFVFDYNGTLTSALICGAGNSNTVAASMADSACLTLTPAIGFFGNSPDEICVVHCFDNDPAQCDTTILQVSVVECLLQVDGVLATPASCADNDGSLEISASGQIGGLDYVWSPAVSNTNLATGLSAFAYYSVTLTDALGCEAVSENMLTGIDCPTLTMSETIPLTLPCGGDPLDLCANADELPGIPNLVEVCGPPAFGSLASVNGACFSYTPNPDFSGMEEVCLNICDEFGVCDTFLFEVLVEQCPQQIPCVAIPEDTLFTQTNRCDEEVKFCVAFPLGEILDYEFQVNGQLYADNLSVCGFDTLLSYGFSAIPGNGMNGPYEVVSWIIDGADIGSGEFEDVFELVDLMNMLDPSGNWALDTLTFNLSSFNTLTDYGQLTVTQQVTGDLAMLNINSATAPAGSALYFPVGIHEVVMTHTEYDFCVDTFTAFIHCAETEVVFQEIQTGQSGSFCPTFTLPGNVETFDLAYFSNENTTAILNGECVDYQGIDRGSDSLLLVACDGFGFCDSTWLILSVSENGLPVAHVDFAVTDEYRSVEVGILDNDFVNGTLSRLRILIDPIHGLAEIGPDHSLTYTPDRGFCGQDALAYELCNENGCDTSAVNIEVICVQPVVYSGFSPNEDGVNDFFKITNLNHFPENELSIFNRWGALVFREKNYASGWDGRDVNQAILPDGTYFYVLDLGVGGTMKGYVQVHR